ncbi:MAG: cell division protein FtsX [Chloroflexota bacterium]
MAFTYSVKSAFQSLFDAKWINLACVFAVASSLLVITVTVVFLYNLEHFTSRLPERFLMVVYLKDNLSSDETRKIEAALKSREDIESTRYISKDDALAELRNILKDKSSILDGLDENPLSPSLEVRLKRSYFTTSTVKNVSDFIRGMKGIDDVYYGEKLAEAIDLTRRSVRNFAIAIFSIFLVVIVFVTYSTVKILFYRKREEIDILRLLGATGGFVRIPFVMEGGAIGFFGGLLAALSAFGVYFVFTVHLGGIVPFLRGLSFPHAVLVALPVVGFLLGVAGSLIAIGRLRS